MIIEETKQGKKYFPMIEDFPYAHALSAESYEHLKSTLEEKYENFLKQRRYIAMLMAKKNAAA